MGDADLAFLAFDRFLGGLPAGVQLFSLLKANPRLLDLLATILGSAPRLAEQLSRRPKVLDAVLDPGFFDLAAHGSRDGAADRRGDARRACALDEVADRARIVGKEQAFRIGVRVLSETAGAAEAGLAFSQLAGPAARPPACGGDGGRGAPPRPRAGRAQRRDRHGQARRPRDDGGLRPRPDHRL